ncbi:multidrug effflux MFS transporter [Planctomicrobium sp. SH668]|uniref:multidrug effflux MFS transporter n=1 Tax=Planctomicrobium sp. SH668 TaxID=3448126 RepID=UPI003F5BFB48
MSLPEKPTQSAIEKRLSAQSSRLRFILLLGLLDACGPLGIDMYLPAYPEIENEFHSGVGAIELTLSMFLAGLAIGQIICGPISDRVGRRLPLIFGSVAFATASIVCAFATSIETLIVSRFIMGLAGSTGMVITRAVVRDCFEERDSARVYSMLMLVIGVAPILSPSFGSWLMLYGSWRLIFWGLGLCGLVCCGFVLFDMPETLPAERRRRDSIVGIAGQYLSMAFDWRFMRFALPATLIFGELFAYVGSAPKLFMNVFGLTSTQFSIAFALNAVGLIGAAQFNGMLIDRFGGHRVLKYAACVNLVFAAMLPVLTWTQFGGFTLFYAANFIAMAAMGIVLPNAAAAVMAPFGRQAGAASALLGMIQFTFAAGVAAVVGKMADGTPQPMALGMAFCACFACFILMFAERTTSPSQDCEVLDPVV